MGLGLQGHINNLRSRGLNPTIVYTDLGSGFRSLTTGFPGTLIDISGAGDYVAKVDAKIRRIKELYRSVRMDYRGNCLIFLYKIWWHVQWHG